MSNPTATWSISLDIDCPFCNSYIDVIPTTDDCDEIADFWEQFSNDMGQCLHNSKDIGVTCPECHKKFIIDCEY